jgi:site-specific DNA-methyltransferase (adenine-specific)
MNFIPDGSVDMILADPPYGTTKCKWDSIIPLKPMWKHLKRIIKSNGAIVMTAQTPFDKVLGVSAIDILRYEWIWEKTSATGHFNSKKMPMKAHENVLVFYKNLPTYNPQKTNGHIRKSAVKQINLNSECYNKNTSETIYDSTDRYPRSVQIFSSDKQKCKLQPTQKPVALMEYLIKTYTNDGEIVLDFCMGSGTTGVSCKNLNRQFIGIEKYSHIFNIAKERIEKVGV